VQANVADTVSAVQKKVEATVVAINDTVEGGELQDKLLELGVSFSCASDITCGSANPVVYVGNKLENNLGWVIPLSGISHTQLKCGVFH
jgi:hypothetical protein